VELLDIVFIIDIMVLRGEKLKGSEKKLAIGLKVSLSM
jgi:hypothetical protein